MANEHRKTDRANESYSRQYSDAYSSYIRSHMEFDFAKETQRLGQSIIVYKGGKQDDVVSIDQLASAYSNKNAWTLLQNALAKQGTLASGEDFQKYINEVPDKISTWEKYVNLIDGMEKDINGLMEIFGGTRGNSAWVKSKMQSLRARVDLIQSNQARIKKIFEANGGVYFDDKGELQAVQQQAKKIDKIDGHTIYYKVSDFRKMYTFSLGMALKHFAEDVSAYMIQAMVPISAAQVTIEELEKMAVEQFNGKGIKKTGLRGAGINPTLKMSFDQLGFNVADAKKYSTISGNTPLVDWRMNVQGREGKGNITFKFSNKQYKTLQGKDGSLKAGEIKAIKGTFQRFIMDAANGDATTYWALVRAMNASEFYDSKNDYDYPTSGELRRVLLRNQIFDAIFGSGDDQITDFVINGYFFSAAAIAGQLFKNNRPGKNVYSKVSGSRVDDGKPRSFEETSVKYFLDLDKVNAILKNSMTFFWNFKGYTPGKGV